MQMLHFWHATRRGTRAPRRPHRTVLVLLALVAALGIGAQVFLWLCWPHGQFALEAEDGSLAALEGFTVQGGRFGSGDTGLAFTLSDGVLTSAPARKPPAAPAPRSFMSNARLAVPAEDYAALNAGAESTTVASKGGAFGFSHSWYGVTYLAETRTLQLTETISVESVPGQSGPNGSVRLNLGSVFYPQPVPVQATRYEPGAPAQLSSGYTGSGDAYATARAVPEDWVAKAGVDLLTAGDEPLLFVRPLAIGTDLARGIYRITDALSDAEIAALPADAALGDTPIRSEATPYGEVICICALEDRETPLLPLAVCGESRVLVTLNDAGDVRLRLFDENWNLTQDTVLTTLTIQPPAWEHGLATSEYELFPLIGLREDEIAFLIYPKAADAAADAWIKMVVARIEEGRVAAQEILCSAGTTGAPIAAGLRNDGGAVMTVSFAQHTERSGIYRALMENPAPFGPSFSLSGDEDPATGSVIDGLRLTVYEEGRPAAAALLRSREQAAWRRQLAYYIANGNEGRIHVMRHQK